MKNIQTLIKHGPDGIAQADIIRRPDDVVFTIEGNCIKKEVPIPGMVGVAITKYYNTLTGIQTVLDPETGRLVEDHEEDTDWPWAQINSWM